MIKTYKIYSSNEKDREKMKKFNKIVNDNEDEYFSEPNDERLAEDALWLLQRAHKLKQGEVQEFYFMECEEEEHDGRNDACERDARRDKEDK